MIAGARPTPRTGRGWFSSGRYCAVDSGRYRMVVALRESDYCARDIERLGEEAKGGRRSRCLSPWNAAAPEVVIRQPGNRLWAATTICPLAVKRQCLPGGHMMVRSSLLAMGARSQGPPRSALPGRLCSGRSARYRTRDSASRRDLLAAVGQTAVAADNRTREIRPHATSRTRIRRAAVGPRSRSCARVRARRRCGRVAAKRALCDHWHTSDRA
jgi:hypothetical protein